MGGDLWQKAENIPFVSQLIASEIKDLWNGDVPFFWTLTDSKDLFDSFGMRYENFFYETGFSAVQKRVQALGEQTVAQKEGLWLSLRSISSVVKSQDSFNYKGKRNPHTATADELVNLSCSIADDLIQKAYYVEDVPFWAGLSPLNNEGYRSSLLLPTLYDGGVGIALFFAYLYKITGKDSYGSVVQGVQHLMDMVVADHHFFFPAGAFSGWGAFSFLNLHLKALSFSKSQEQENDDLFFSKWRDAITQDRNYDIISGSAGALIVAIRHLQVENDPRIMEIAKGAAQNLIDAAEIEGNIATWNILPSEKEPQRLGGLAHGVSGVAWALSLWAQLSGDKTVLPIIQKAFNYEQTLFDPDLRAWREARGQALSCHWCYGAPGIAIALNDMKHVLDSEPCDALITDSQKATWKYGLSIGHGLCHGNLGNSDFYLLTGDRDRAQQILSFVLRDYKKKGYWTCDIPGPPAIPGLMCGLSGVGYMLLRHAFPDQIPSVLALEGARKLKQ